LPGSSVALYPELGLVTTHHTETNMEKTANSSTGTKVPPRSSSTGPIPGETKAKTEGKNNGSSKRYSRKREPSFPKSDTFPGPRRTNSQKGKNFDKRPPQRGGRQYGVAGGGRREEVAEARRAEFSPAQFAGPKKISLNHLLNFTFEPRGGNGADGGHACWGRRNKWGHKHKPFNKELFLQANCQFVVNDDQDYKAHFTDPDTLVNWDCVQQVRINSHEVPSCPICLYPPLAARITRCGHIFCWPCMLHYLSLSDRSWSKCPICYEAVHTADLKSVVAMETKQYGVGDVITMRLMRREKGSLVAVPSCQWEKVEEPVRFGDTRLSPYSKLLLASPSQALRMVEEEKAALQTQLSLEDDAQGCFLQSALCLLKEREEMLLQQQKNSSMDVLNMSSLTLEEELSSVEEVLPKTSSSKPVLEYSSAFDDLVVEVSEVAPLEPPTSPENILECVPEEPPEDMTDLAPELESAEDNPGRAPSNVVPGPYYYFYQADDCQQMFLHPVNIRCLLREYGSLEASPDSITAAVVEIVGHTVTEEIRRRHRYLAHLPLTCEFSICELVLQPPVLSKETLETFAGPGRGLFGSLDVPTRIRPSNGCCVTSKQRRLRPERAPESPHSHPEVHIGLENLQHFPAFGSPPGPRCPPAQPDFTVVDPPSPPGSSPSSDVGRFPLLADQSGSSTVGSMEDDSHCMSFAQMLRDGKAKMDSGAWVAPKKDKLLAPPAADSDGESDGSDRVPVPSFQNSFSQAIEKALLQLDSEAASVPPPVLEPGPYLFQMKKEILFSTSMVHTK
uniref:E3 ubiquitin-protein ligase RNF10 n=1 Tax=Tetraodon nigroviridis TaxID=99883 RepID=H3C888_TETNG